MKLHSFEVENFRNLSTLKLDKIGNYLVIIGPNGSGKSNLLRSLYIAFNILRKCTSFIDKITFSGGFGEGGLYDLTRIELDYSKKADLKRRPACIVYRIGFKVSDFERRYINKSICSFTGDIIGVEIRLENKGTLGDDLTITTFDGRGELEYKEDDYYSLIEYINERINGCMIPTYRTGEHIDGQILELFNSWVDEYYSKNEMESLFSDIQKRVDDYNITIANRMLASLQCYLPKLQGIEIDIPIRSRGISLDPIVKLDDGNLTYVQQKGDGFKSLLALALFLAKRHVDDVVYFIDEPELYLNPSIIGEVSSMLKRGYDKTQFIISTHNINFIDLTDDLCPWEGSDSTILLNEGVPTYSPLIADIRATLGREINPDFLHGFVALLVEGQEDKLFYRRILSIFSPDLSKYLESDFIKIYTVEGAGNIGKKAQGMNDNHYQIIALVDGDKAGRLAKSKMDELHLPFSHSIEVELPHVEEAMLEDLINPKIYESYIEEKYDIKISGHLGCDSFPISREEYRKKNWAKRVNILLTHLQSSHSMQDIPSFSTIKKEINECLKDCINRDGILADDIIVPEAKGFIKSLVMKIQNCFSI